MALIPVGYLVLPDSRKYAADLSPANIANPLLSENTSIDSARTGGGNVTDLSPPDVANPALSESTPINSVGTAEPAPSVRAPDSAAESVAVANDDENRRAENRSETVSRTEKQPVNESKQAASSGATPEEVHSTALFAGALTRPDEPVASPQRGAGAASEKSEDSLSVQTQSSDKPPVAAEHQSVVVAGEPPRPESANPGAADSPDFTAGPAPQDSKPAEEPSFVNANPSATPPAPAPPTSAENPRAPGTGGTLSGFVSIQRNDAAEVPSPSPSPSPVPKQQTNELRGYIAFAAKNEPAASLPVAQRFAKVTGHRANADEIPPEPRARAPKTEDIPAAPPKPPEQPRQFRSQSGQLQGFASDFVRTEGSGNIGEERQFFADSVHFYKEGDLSLAGVAAATRRYHQGKQKKQFQPAGSASVQGPVNGGFYLVEQPVSWSRVEGSSLVRGRSVLRLRVLPTGSRWKITSIEEVGQ